MTVDPAILRDIERNRIETERAHQQEQIFQDWVSGLTGRQLLARTGYRFGGGVADFLRVAEAKWLRDVRKSQPWLTCSRCGNGFRGIEGATPNTLREESYCRRCYIRLFSRGTGLTKCTRCQADMHAGLNVHKAHPLHGQLNCHQPVCSVECLYAIQREQNEAERLRRIKSSMWHWQLTCPPPYQKSDPKLIPDPVGWERVQEWDYNADEDDKGLLIIGRTGTGKTRSLWARLRKQAEAGLDFIATTGADLASDIIKFTRPGGKGFEEYFASLVETSVLAIDEFDKVTWTERVTTEIFRLLNARVESASVTLFIMASSLPEFSARITEAEATKKLPTGIAAQIVRRIGPEFNTVVPFIAGRPTPTKE